MSDPYASIAVPVRQAVAPPQHQGGDPYAGVAEKQHPVWEDALRSSAAGLAQGAIGMGSMAGDLQSLGNHGMAWLVEHLGMSHAQAQAALAQTEDFRRQYGSVIPTGGATTAENQQAAAHVVPQVNYQPQSVPGKYARTVGQFAPSAVGGGGSVLAKAGRVLLPAVASETAGQLADSSPKTKKYGTAVRLAAALAAGGATAAVTGSPRGSIRTLANATEGVTDDQLAHAAQLGQKGKDIGVPLTMGEAVQSAAPHARMNQVLRDVETSPQGAPLREAFAQRPGQVQGASKSVLDAIAPAGDPAEIGVRAQGSAKNALRALEAERTVATKPLYTAANPQMVDPAEIDALVNDIRMTAGADKTKLLAPELEKLASTIRPEGSNRPILDVENLDRIRKYFRDRVSLPPGSADALDKESAGKVGGYLDQLDQILEKVPGFAAAKGRHAELSRSIVEPAFAGPLGTIQKTPDVTAQTRALFPSSPPEGQADVTSKAMARMFGNDEKVPADLTRQYLAKALAEKSQDLQTGPNTWGGAKFATEVGANPEQAKTLAAALAEAAPEAQAPTKDLLDVLKATGTRLAPGSETAEKLQSAQDMKSGELAGGNILAGASPPRIFQRVYTWLDDITQEGNRKRLVEAMKTDPSLYSQVIRKAQADYSAGRLGQRELRSLLSNAEAVKVQAEQ